MVLLCQVLRCIFMMLRLIEMTQIYLNTQTPASRFKIEAMSVFFILSLAIHMINSHRAILKMKVILVLA